MFDQLISAAGAGVELPEFDVSETTETVTPWNVVVYDDPVNLMSYVTRVFQKVFGYSEEKSHELMLQVHNHGRSIVWSGEREKAELYVQQLQSFLLKTRMEKAD